MKVEPHFAVHEIVTARTAAARVLDRLGIDYCCRGDQSLVESCERRGLSVESVLAELERIDGGSAERDLGALSLGALADDIVRTHHVYLHAELPAISAKIDRVVTEHGGRDHRLADVRRVFRSLHAELDDHMRKEEQILFPLCHALDRDGAAGGFCGSVRHPIAMMVEEHADAGSALDHLKELTDGYEEPLDSCLTHRTLIGQLAHLEEDLHRHIHKENYILFPKAIAREDAVDGR